GRDRARPAARLAGRDESRHGVLRDPALHQVLPVVVGLDARLPLLPHHRPGRDVRDPRAAASADVVQGGRMIRRLTPPIAIVVVVNALMLAGAAVNRSGEPEARVRLTERELRLATPGDRDSGRELILDAVDQRVDAAVADAAVSEGTRWFDAQKLRAVGFD